MPDEFETLNGDVDVVTDDPAPPSLPPAPEPTDATPPAPPPEEPPAPAEEPPQPDPAGPAGEDDERAILEYIQAEGQRVGVDLSKYRSFADFVRGSANQAKLVGSRNDDAQLGRQLRENPAAVLAQLGLTQQPQQQPQPEAGPPSYDRYRYLASQVERDENGNLKPVSGASPEVVGQLREIAEYRDRALHEFAMNPQGFLGPVMEQYVNQAVQNAVGQVTASTQQMVAQTTQAQQRKAEADAWMARHKNEVYVNGDPNQGTTSEYTQLEKMLRNMNAPAIVQSGQWTVSQALDYARNALRGVAPPPSAPLNTRAQVTPDVANAPAPQDNNLTLRNGETFADLMRRMNQANQDAMRA